MASISFKRGDTRTITIRMPRAAYVPGSRLSFAAKKNIDDDISDAAAVINVTWTDASVTLDDQYATYNCTFTPAQTSGITLGKQTSATLKGEFQYVTPNGTVKTWPSGGKYIDVKVLGDVRRSIA